MEINYEKIGEIHGKIKNEVYNLLKPGISLYEIREYIEKRILEEGYGIAFPVGVNLNECAAHFSPFQSDNLKLKSGDLITVDFGIHKNGYIIDSAFTKEIDTNNYQNLINASKDSVYQAINAIKPCMYLRDIGKIINDTVSKYNCNNIIELCGHKIEPYIIHAGKAVPCFNIPNYNEIIVEGEVYAVEVFTTNGNTKLIEKEPISHYALNSNKTVKNIQLNEIKMEYLNILKKWKTLPFHIDTIESKHLNDLINNDVLLKYPPLYSNKVVSHWEHTVIVTKEGCKMLSKEII